uniref:Fucosyltransferase n=1 Tax=Lepisosteus oculatus TaxID=7918 RepID=W5NNB3_LEPOC
WETEALLTRKRQGLCDNKQCHSTVMKTLYPQVFFAAFACVLLALFLCYQNLPQPLQNFPRLDSEANRITILIWWRPFGNKNNFTDCGGLFGIHGCTLTTHRDLYPQAEAVIIHHREIYGNLSRLPQRPRPFNQKWIWMNFESPTHTSGLEELEGIFNWTMSYKVGSDIFMPYGYLHPKKTGSKSTKVLLPRKKGLIAWIISNWNEDHARVEFYHRLRMHVPIHIYGREGMELINNSIVQTASQYKFYLAFENSQHPDYITEKLWNNALKSSAVPVVLGPPRENYELFLPSDSFIHVDDFHSPRVLAAYLKFLDKNPRLYRKYFNWRKKYDVHVTSFWSEHYCAVCKAVRAAQYQTKTVKDLALWFET